MNGRAFVFTGVRQPFEAREFPLPEVEPDGILVRVTVANICGSDLHGWHGRTPRSGPTIMGHEMTGRIARLGARVTTDAAGAPLREGDRVVYSYFYPCWHCDLCRAGDSHHCSARRIGAGRARSDAPPHFTGAYADYYYLPRGHYVLRTPDALDDLTVAPLNCALAQVIYGLHQADACIQFLGPRAFVTLEAEFHVLGGNGFAIVELEAPTQFELVREPVRALRPRLRQAVAHLLPR